MNMLTLIHYPTIKELIFNSAENRSHAIAEFFITSHFAFYLINYLFNDKE